jgi:hypothetical protein
MPDKIYAIRHKGELARFAVDEVVTRRTRSTGSPHDYKSEVVGRLWEDESRQELTLAPEAILGPYEEHAELVVREAAERKARDAAKKAKDQTRYELARLLFALVGMWPNEEDLTAYRSKIRVTSATVNIDDDLVEPMIKAIRQLFDPGENELEFAREAQRD